MIVGIGIDMVDISRIRAAHARFGRRFFERILTSAELRELHGDGILYAAGRFAAKEAAVKALRTGFASGIGPRQIETLRLPSGAPGLRLLGPAQRLAQGLGVRAAHLSISHERAVAVALVVLEA